MLTLAQRLARRTGLAETAIDGCVRLLEAGNTVPFIARYRKEATSGLDETQIRTVSDALAELQQFDARKATILQTLEELGVLTPELHAAVEKCTTKTELEDLYLPYKPKRSTRAEKARKCGVEPLALALLGRAGGAVVSGRSTAAPGYREALAAQFVSPDKGVADVETAIQLASDIVADIMASTPEVRKQVRELGRTGGSLISRKKRGAGDEAATFADYFQHSEPVARAAAHRVLALLRGEAAGALSVGVECDDARGMRTLTSQFVDRGPAWAQRDLEHAAEDAWSRLLWPSIEREILAELKDNADITSVRVFGSNLRALLMTPPEPGSRVLGVDPGFRNGCKLAAVSETGDVLAVATVYPHDPQNQKADAGAKIVALVERFRLTRLAVGDGTAHRETLRFLDSLKLPSHVEIVSVSEAGASVYSASPLAVKEMPDLDVTHRGAVSIARRLQDPLAELVKIEPKAIGVGQYQHDVDQTLLARKLSEVVEECVNRVGVQVNTASPSLLAYVAGIGPATANAIVQWRSKNGRFDTREDLRKVGGLGPARFLQCSGFLRIRDGNNALDATGIHPERYDFLKKVSRVLGRPLVPGTLSAEQREAAKQAMARLAAGDANLGSATLHDILQELERPSVDPRGARQKVEFSDLVHEMADLRQGMVLPGRVTNVTDFGAFVDIGVHKDGLIHVSRIDDRRIDNPSQVLRPGQAVTVKVLEVDISRQRISLSSRPSDTGKKIG